MFCTNESDCLVRYVNIDEHTLHLTYVNRSNCLSVKINHQNLANCFFHENDNSSVGQCASPRVFI